MSARMSLVGREVELREVVAQIGVGRVVTLSGAPGIGKTRLAREVGKVSASPHLLILDGIDDALPEARAKAVAWLARSREARVLAVTRERLALPLERVMELGPLATADAARLFVERAHPKLTVAEVMGLVEALEGVPLSVELCADMTRRLGVEALRRRAARPLTLLPALRESIQTSLDRLSDDECAAFVVCGAFSRAFTVAAAEEALVRAGVNDPLRALRSLRERSLLRRENGHLIMLSPIRDVAREQPGFLEEHAGDAPVEPPTAQDAMSQALIAGDAQLEARASLRLAEAAADAGQWSLARHYAARAGSANAGGAVVAAHAALQLGDVVAARTLLQKPLPMGAHRPLLLGVLAADERQWGSAAAAFAEAASAFAASGEPTWSALAEAARAVMVGVHSDVEEGRRLLEAARGDLAMLEPLRTAIELVAAVNRPDARAVAALRHELDQPATSLSRPASLCRHIAEHIAATYAPPEDALTLCEVSQWVRLPDGKVRSFRDRPMLWRFTHALARMHTRAPGNAVSRDELIEAIWPGERITQAAAQNRLSVAIHKMKNSSLALFVERSCDGLRFQPNVRVIWAETLHP